MTDDPDRDAEPALDGLNQQMRRLDDVTQAFGRSLSRALASGIAQGKSFEDVLRNLGQRLIEIGLRAAFKPLESGLGSLFEGLSKGGAQLFAGSVGQPLSITPFAEGGIVGAPGLFPLGRGLGIAGERGAEAILPLARGPDGRLGLAARGEGAPVRVSMQIVTPDAESFRRAEGRIGASLARAVARVQRRL